MIDDATEATTAEICMLSDLSKQRLGQLEAGGIIKRAGKDRWPLIATVRALFADARARSSAHSDARARYEVARAIALEMKTQREAGDLVPTAAVENYTKMAFGRIRVEHSSLPARYTRNVEERQRLERLLDEADTRTADYLEEQGDALWGEAQKAARRRS